MVMSVILCASTVSFSELLLNLYQQTLANPPQQLTKTMQGRCQCYKCLCKAMSTRCFEIAGHSYNRHIEQIILEIQQSKEHTGVMQAANAFTCSQVRKRERMKESVYV